MNIHGRVGHGARRTLGMVSLGALSFALVLASGIEGGGATTATTAWPADVFAVGTFGGVAGNVTCAKPGTVGCIQQAVNDAEAWAGGQALDDGGVVPDTYVLLAPGDYKTDPSAIEPAPQGQGPAGVLVTGANVWIVGMNRNSVIVDGTKSGPPCSTAPKDQVFGPSSNPAEGLNGIMIYKAPGSWVENLTTCNFLNGTGGYGGAGNEIWWNGGANSGTVFVDTQGGYVGKYLTATSTYFGTNPADPTADPETWSAAYGIFSSNWDGGTWNRTYASNFNDSGYYIGACQQECNQKVDHAWSEYNALGYSGSNSGGWLLVEHSTFDNNEDGFDTNSQNGDNPPPQDGACPPGVAPPTLPGLPVSEQPATCWVFYDNHVHNNNNPDVPTAGSAAAGPVGTGMSVSGGRDDTVLDNTFTDNGAWGTILVPYPDSGPPCTGGTYIPPGSTPVSGQVCWYDEYGDAVIGNSYANNGFFGNPTNGDIGAVNLEPGPTDCFAGNTDGSGLTTSPPLAEVLYPKCTGMTVPPDANGLFADEVACDSASIQIGPVAGSTACPPGANYPRRTEVTMHRLPDASALAPGGSALENPSSTSLEAMPNPCADFPSSVAAATAWCSVTSG